MRNRLSIPLLAWGASFLVETGAAQTVDYVAEIKPLLAEHCYGCHGVSQQKGGLRLDTAAFALQGGESGPAYIPGQSAESLLLQTVEGTHDSISRMPYKKPALSPEQVALLSAWINAGAPAPEQEESASALHWSFIPPTRPPLPPPNGSVQDEANPIDRFISARLESQGIAPADEADRTTLLRRLSLDLTGLPPSPDEIKAFLKETRPDAYSREIERLLASPHYGERWGRWWLDAARYGDSNGYSIDAPRTIWKYRDWVVQALNRDLPFDQFTVDQLAGDLLPGASIDQKIATGFNRNTQINQEGGIDPEQFRIESVMDRVNTFGTVFLGLTVACAQCHDHKFDPISQREYYQLFSFFNNTVEDGHGKATPGGLLEVPVEDDWIEESPRQKKPVVTLVMQELDEPRTTALFINGDFTRPAETVKPGALAILHPFPSSSSGGGQPNRLDLARWVIDPANPLTARVIVNRVWQQYFGRGLVETENDFGTQGSRPTHPELLDWLAREFVNPVHGADQTPPWSLKHLHRLIVTSASYRQSSRARPELAAIDPDNRMLARQSRLRLDAEIIRDNALAASGLLVARLGGPPVFPPQPDGVMNLGQSRREWKPSTGGDRFRRALYTHFWRATPHPALTAFDAPDGFSACTRRIRSNTPLQALTLLNDQQYHEFAQALARRVLREGGSAAADRIGYAFQLCLAREPDPVERARLEQLLAELDPPGAVAESPEAAWTIVARVLLNLDETITRE